MINHSLLTLFCYYSVIMILLTLSCYYSEIIILFQQIDTLPTLIVARQKQYSKLQNVQKSEKCK